MAQDLIMRLTPEETARALGVGRSTLYRLNSAGKIPQPLRVGKRLRWRARELRDWARAGGPPRSRWAWPADEAGGVAGDAK